MNFVLVQNQLMLPFPHHLNSGDTCNIFAVRYTFLILVFPYRKYKSRISIHFCLLVSFLISPFGYPSPDRTGRRDYCI
jgi:hypothetical protein